MKKIITVPFIFLFLFLLLQPCFPAILQQSLSGTQQKINFLFGVFPKQQNILVLPTSTPTPEPQNILLPNTVLPSISIPFQISARYIKVNVPQIESLIQRYKEIPGGIVLEGSALGLESIQNVVFDSKSTMFQINHDYSYSCPISAAEVKAIAEALDKDDLLGVSLGEQTFVYGNLTEGSFPTIYLQLADHFLGSIVFANQEALKAYPFPGGYLPLKEEETGGCFAVCFNVDRYAFKCTDKKIYACSSADFSTTLIPLLVEKNAEGRFLPDFDTIQKGELPSAYEKNAIHVVENILHYQQDVRIQKIIRYGEVAAFLRTLKTQGISLQSLFQSA
jgi:hypothetical protein